VLGGKVIFLCTRRGQDRVINVLQGDQCVGNTGGIPRLGFRPLCMQDSPLGVRFADYVSAFPAGVTVAASWDRAMCYQRGKGMGSEHFGKGIVVQLRQTMN